MKRILKKIGKYVYKTSIDNFHLYSLDVYTLQNDLYSCWISRTD